MAVLNKPYGFCGRKSTFEEDVLWFRLCVKVEVAVLGSPSLIVLMVSVDGKQLSTLSDSAIISVKR